MKPETIAAISTAVGEAGIGIVRISGPDSLFVADRIFRGAAGRKLMECGVRRMVYGTVTDPETGDMIDEVLAVFMPGPHSYTCEDVVEIQSHGGPTVVRRILSAALNHGARLAEPGEFTKRAFLNGRLDLAQAEAVMGIIRAKTEAALKISTGQLSGNLSIRIKELRAHILDLIVTMEAGIDFPEDDLDGTPILAVAAETKAIAEAVNRLLLTASAGIILRDGLQTVIVGRPNVGKSSILNALLRESRALVTEIPGTTRDSIEEYVNLRGIPLRLVDTAGLREAKDIIERLGIERTRLFLGTAGLVLFVLDSAEPLSAEDRQIAQDLPEVPTIVVLNKSDLEPLINEQEILSLCQPQAVVRISAKEGWGLHDLEERIESLALGGAAHLSEPIYVDNIRHTQSLREAFKYLMTAVEALQDGLNEECALIDLRLAVEALGQITGESVSEEIVREIFAKFCLGK